MQDPFVVILLSTYNGEKFLPEQLDSIFSQKDINFLLLVRDDGSKDGTVKILKNYKKLYPNITLILGENVGSCKSFFLLLEECILKFPNADYISFCDQDDVWLPDKLSKAILRMTECVKECPTLYYSNLEVVDKNLNHLGYMIPKGHSPEKNISLLDHKATGCTIVINNKFLYLYEKFKMPQKAIMHDWWLFLLGIYFGRVIYDENSYIKYRQHNNNVYGARRDSFFIRVGHIIRDLFKPNSQHYRQHNAIEFLSVTHEYLSPKDKKIINCIAFYNKSIFTKIYLAMNFNNFRKLSYPIRIRILLGLI